MIPVPRDANRNDIDQWCNRCVVLARHGETYIPCWFLGVLDNRECLLRPLEDRNDRQIRKVHTDLMVTWPMCGSINLPVSEYAVHAARQTQRQYRRSWHMAALSITIPRMWDVARKRGERHSTLRASDQEVAEACFAPRYFSLEEAFDMIDKGQRVTVAVSRSLIVAGDSEGKRMFYYLGQLAATAYGTTLYPTADVLAFNRIVKLTEGRYAPQY